MGCMNESGCLGPKRREREVYADLLDAMHSETQKIEFTNNLNMYQVVRERLIKKGFLRKLLDNLTSHRSKINDCLAVNFRLATQSSRIENKYAGLIVLNQIVNNLYNDKKTGGGSLDEKTQIKTATSQSKTLIEAEALKSTAMAPDLRTDMHFFWLVLHLLENYGRMYLKALESITVFCSNRREKLAVRAEIWRILELILQKLRKGVHEQESADAYLALIEQLKDNTQEESEEDDIFLVFLRLWLQKHAEGDVYEGPEASLEIKYEKIIKVLVRRCISCSKSTTIYRAIFSVYDEQKFQGPKVLALQRFVFRVIQQHDLHSSTIRGLFLYLLQYLSVIRNSDRTNLLRSSEGDEFNLIRYPRIADKLAKLKGFQTLRRWGENGYLNLEEYVSFSASPLVRAYTLNLSNQKEYAQDIMREFLRLTEQFKSEFTLILVSLLMEEIKYQNANQQLRQKIIVLVREVIEARHLLERVPKSHFVYFIPIETTFSRDSRIELIQLMGFIAKHLPSYFYSVKEQTDSLFFQNLCEFLFTAYESMIVSGGQPRSGKRPEEDEILFKYQFGNSMISFLKCLTEKGAYPIVLAYISSMTASLHISLSTGKINTYFLLYVIYEGMHLLNSKQKIPDKMAALNFRLAPSLRAHEIRPELERLVDQLLGSRGELTQKLTSDLNATIEHLRQFIMLSEEEYRQANTMFGDYFRNAKPESLYMDMSRTQFRRESAVSEVNSTDNDRSRLEDQSFKDIFERINDI